MDINFSSKIRLLLNELAILNQPEQNAGKIVYEKEILLKIKSLGTELYFLTVQAIEQEDFITAEEEVSQPTPTEIFRDTKAETEIIPEETVNREIHVDVKEEPVPLIVETEPELTVEELKDNSIVSQPTRTAESVNNQISFTRRFEYINNLFSGNAELYLEFLENLSKSDTEDEAMAIFKQAFHENNWSKKEETAQDFKKLIHKIF